MPPPPIDPSLGDKWVESDRNINPDSPHPLNPRCPVRKYAKKGIVKRKSFAVTVVNKYFQAKRNVDNYPYFPTQPFGEYKKD